MSSFTVSTKKDKNAVAVNTALTIEDGSPEVIKALAYQALVVKWQAWARKHGIPATASIKMDDFAPGTRHGGPTLQEAVKVLTPAERAALIAQLQAMK